MPYYEVTLITRALSKVGSSLSFKDFASDFETSDAIHLMSRN